jgi:hypothetical protein
MITSIANFTDTATGCQWAFCAFLAKKQQVSQSPTSWLNSTEKVAQHIPYRRLSKTEISKVSALKEIGGLK